jgi:hypothetical protein
VKSDMRILVTLPGDVSAATYRKPAFGSITAAVIGPSPESRSRVENKVKSDRRILESKGGSA